MLIPDLSPLWISLKVSLLATIVTFGLGTSVAYKMYHYRGKARSLIEGLLIAPLILPPTVVGFILLVLLGKNGILGQMLAQWHLQLVFTWYAAVLAAIVVSFERVGLQSCLTFGTNLKSAIRWRSLFSE